MPRIPKAPAPDSIPGTPRPAAGARAARISPAALAIGIAGCVIITASSAFTALKMGSLPWPTIFTSITAFVLLRACGRGGLSEANATQVIMSAGSMVAGGLAFTVPGAWMLGLADEVGPARIFSCALAGTLMGLVCTALIRRRFVEESGLEYPIGTAAAATLKASTDRGGTARRLFGSMALAGAWAALRDVAGAIPSMLFALPVPGVSLGVYASPMMLSVGFLVGFGMLALAMVGGIVANFAIVVGGVSSGLLAPGAATGIVKSLGMGLMMGSGLGVVLKDILAPAVRSLARRGVVAGPGAAAGAATTAGAPSRADRAGLAAMTALSAVLLCAGVGLPPAICAVVVALSFVTTIMSAQSVGSTGIDPMEIFGLIVLIAVAALADLSAATLFLVAGVVAVTCGLAGDVMSDFKTGSIIGADPRQLWRAQALGALIGAVVATGAICALFAAYGAEAFGPGRQFVAAQASVVATMVSGIPSVPAFAAGLAAGIGLYLAGVPSMMLGLGVYLPFYMTLTMFLGAAAKRALELAARRRGADGEVLEERVTVVASGMLGGESIVGVLVALAGVVSGLLG